MAQLHVLEYEAEFERKEQEFEQVTSNLTREADGMRTRLAEAEAACVDRERQMEQRTKELTSNIEALTAQIGALKDEREKEESEHSVLLRVLHTELEVWGPLVCSNGGSASLLVWHHPSRGR